MPATHTVQPLHAVGKGKGPIHYTDFECNGTEQSLLSCPFETVELYSNTLCDHSRDVHVACQGTVRRAKFGRH